MSYKVKDSINLIGFVVVIILLLGYTLVFLTTVGWKLVGLLIAVGIVIMISFNLCRISALNIQLDKVIVASRNENIKTCLTIEKNQSGFVFFPILKIEIKELGVNQVIYGYTGNKQMIDIHFNEKQRGKYKEVMIETESGDLFSFFKKKRDVLKEVDWMILPEFIPNVDSVLSLIEKKRDNEPIGEQTYDIKSHRAYVHGDSMKQVDWKLSGKSQEIIVKEYHQVVEKKLSLVFLGQASFYFEALLDVFFSLYQLSNSLFDELYLIGEGVSLLPVKHTDEFAKVSKLSSIHLDSFLNEKNEDVLIFIPEMTSALQRVIDDYSTEQSIQVITYQDLKDSGCVK